MNKSLSLLVLVLACFIATTGAAVQYVQGVLRDQSDANMNVCSAKGGSGKGSAGEANGGKGFPDTDFQMPLGSYTNNEKGLVGKECNAVNGWWPPACGKTGLDRTPVYAYTGKSPGNNIHSPASFYTWFHDTNRTRNEYYSVPLTSTTSNSNVYTYHNSSQFPLDGLGWKDYCGNEGNKANHNYGYCFEAHFRFGYQGGEVFQFTGDDDVWVYIDDRLVIDLGALHEELSAEIRVDTIPGLVKSTSSQSTSYRFDFFYCERHTTESNMKITTSLVAFCSYYDWCGVCEGNGQSCCSEDFIKNECNDNDACTTDLCAVRVPPKQECQHIPSVNCTSNDKCVLSSCNKKTGKCDITNVVCNDGNACTDDRCDAKTGCQFIPKFCDDNSLCTTDACSPTDGTCKFTPITCNDNNDCTTDSCVAKSGCQYETITCPTDSCVTTECLRDGGCKNTTVVCDDKDSCTTDSCSRSSGCKFEKKICDDKNACTLDTCDKTAGCKFTNVTCNDNNACTTDSCNPSSGCQYSPIDCPDVKCQVKSCDPAKGCTYTPLICNDNVACTDDSCDAKSGQCVFTPKVCDDNAACTTDSCDASTGKCTFTPVTCDDKNKCTVDKCDNSTGCGTTPLPCNDNNDCTTDTCNAATGCVFTDISSTCNDNNMCTDDTCKAVGGCSYTKKSCDDGDACTIDDCSPATGCKYTKVVCNDNDACTTDTCTKDKGCTYVPIICNDADLCTTDSCNPLSGCNFTKINCDDNNGCTIDSCDKSVGCKTKNRDCSTPNPCIKGQCNPDLPTGCFNTTLPDCTKCTFVDCTKETTDKCFPKICDVSDGKCIDAPPVDCNDNNACTADSCNAGVCTNAPITCSDPDPCIIVTCDKTKGCVKTPMVCNDNNKCTGDACVAGKCQYTILPCTDNNLCTIDSCDAKLGCNSTAIVCDDNNKCTTEACNASTGKCDYTPVVCPKKPCQVESCVPATGCQYVGKTCDDTNACTDDSCPTASGDCKFTPKNCTALTGATKCHIVSCDPTTGCSAVKKNCTDNNPCTTDTCDLNTGACVFTPLDVEFCLPCKDTACTWTDSCLPKICNNVTNKCEEKKVVCDDKSKCTTDTCDGSGPTAKCIYTPISCPTVDLCSPATCNATVGCVNTPVPCDDGNLCTDDQCKVVAGEAKCLFVDVICKEADKCHPAACNVTTGLCSTTTITCDDNNLCTQDSCDLETGKCVFTPNTCSPDACSPEVCDPKTGSCVADPLDCNDNNPCNIDTVVCGINNATGLYGQYCVYADNLTICDDGDFCTEDICDSSVPAGMNPCRIQNVTCPTVDACYDDFGCVPGVGCKAELKACARNDTNTSDFCNLAKCDPYAGCTFEPRVCPNKDIGCFDAVCDNVTRECREERKDGFGSSKSKNGIICPLVWDPKAKAAAITGGALAGVIIGCIAAAALIGFGGKKGFDYLMAKNSPMGPVATNPLYTQAASSGNNPMYSN